MSIVLAVISTERETKVGLFAYTHTHTQSECLIRAVAARAGS